MKLTHIRNVVALAECGSLLLAAAELGVSQHAVIRSVRELERDLGTALFKRGRKPMMLTPLGQMFVRRASAAHRELDRAIDEVSRFPESSTGLVSIGLSSSPLLLDVPDALRTFRSHFEHVRVRIVEGDFSRLQHDVRGGVLDFYVGSVGPHHHHGSLKIEKLYDVPAVVVARATHPLAGAKSLAQLADARWIATSRNELDPLFEHLGLPRPMVVVEAETGLGMLSAVASSDALLVLSTSWMPLIERVGLLTTLQLNEALQLAPIFMVRRTENALTPAAAYLHDLILEAPPRSAMASLAGGVGLAGLAVGPRRDGGR